MKKRLYLIGGFSLCYLVLLPGCSSVPKPQQSQPVVVTSPTSSPASASTPSPSPVPQPVFFSKLHLLKPVYNGRKITVRGVTDLPNGARVDVSFKVAGRSEDDEYLGVDDKAQVQNGKFAVELTLPNRPAYGSGKYAAEVLFTPRDQTSDILAQVGNDGEKLIGSQVEKGSGFKMLNAIRSIRHRFKLAETHYVMVKPSKYAADSAERAFANFLVAWKQKDWDRMATVTQKTEKASEDNPAESLKNKFDIEDLLEAKITKTVDVTDEPFNGENAKDITAEIQYSIGNESGVLGFQIHKETVVARVIRESAAFTPDASGDWGVNPFFNQAQ